MPARATYTRAFPAELPGMVWAPRAAVECIRNPDRREFARLRLSRSLRLRDRAFDDRASCVTSINAVSNSSPGEATVPRARVRLAARLAPVSGADCGQSPSKFTLATPKSSTFDRVSAAAVWFQPDVVGLQIAMDDSMPVRFRKGQSNLVQKVRDQWQYRSPDWLSGNPKASGHRETPSPDTAWRRRRLSQFRNP